MLARRIQVLSPSPTVSLDAKVKELQGQGASIINLTVGEPDFRTPENISHAAITAIHDGFTHYAPAAGIPDLRQAIAEKLKKDNQLEYAPGDIVVGVGTKQLLFSIFQVICEEGDEVLISTPTWATYAEQVRLAGATPITFPLQPPFILTATDLENHITKKTKAVILNSPCNPTGAVIPKNELGRIAALCVKHQLYAISDEIYEKIIYEGEHCSIASFGQEIKDLTITVNGFSKAYAMTGWRVGYAAGPKDVVAGLISLAGQTTSGTSSVSQKAAVAALTGDQLQVSQMTNEFKKRRDFLLNEFRAIMGIQVSAPTGAFYLFLDVSQLLKGKYTSTTEWTQALLTQAGVAVVPGEAFLSPGYVRLSYAASFETLQEGVSRLKKFIGTQ